MKWKTPKNTQTTKPDSRIKNLNRSTTGNENRSVIKNLSKRKSQDPDGFTSKFYHLEN